jgi:glycolate oxidase FAD binding subunit
MRVDSEEQAVEAVREARERRTTLEIVGGGTRRSVGRPVACDEILDVSKLRGIVTYEPEEMILTVRPGTPLAEIDALLSSQGQRLGFDPQDWSALLGSPGTATIGGAISCNADGPAAIRYGRARDHLLGIRAVNGFGEAFKAGGRVVKNVTGFDIPKLVCGAMGTLCVLTELTFRVFPRPEAEKVFAIGGLTQDDGLSALRKVWSSPLEATGLALLSLRAWNEVPQIPETEHLRYVEDDEDQGLINDCAAIIRIEGSSASLAEREAMLRTILAEYRPAEIEDQDGINRVIAGGTAFVDTLEDVWLLSQPQAASADIVRYSGSVWIADWAGGRIWLRGTPGHDGSWERRKVSPSRGSAILIRASVETRKRTAPFTPEEPARAALTRAVKAAFDPLGLFNPSRMYEGV